VVISSFKSYCKCSVECICFYWKCCYNLVISVETFQYQWYWIQLYLVILNSVMYSSIKSCVKIDQNTLTDLFSWNKGIRQGDGLSPVLFSLFMNDLPQYFKQNKCPGVVLRNRSLNCLMYADDLLVISPSPEGLQ